MKSLLRFALLGVAIVAIAAAACSPAQTPAPTETPVPPTPAPEKLELTSPAFSPGGMIPVKYTHYDENVSLPLEWSDPPEGTQSFALLVYSDPLNDGGGNWVQWVLYNIPPETRALPEGIIPDADGRLPDGSQHYENSWGELGYGGPNPQHVSTGTFYFELYALDTTVDLNAVAKALDEAGELPWIGPSKVVFLNAIEGHVLAVGELVGKHKREAE